MSDKKYWEPVLCDDTYFARLRKDYPENAAMSDSELHDHYNDSRKYQVLWDHLGDAYSDYEPLADAYLSLENRNARLTGLAEEAVECLMLESGRIPSFTKRRLENLSGYLYPAKALQE